MYKTSNRTRNSTITPVRSLNIQARVRNTFHNVFELSVLVPQYEAGERNRGITKRTVPWLVRLVAGFSPGMPAFDPLSVRVRFVMGKLALGQAFICDYFAVFSS